MNEAHVAMVEEQTNHQDEAPRQEYSVQEVAEAMDQHVNSVRRNLQRGKLRGVKVGGEWIILRSALIEWLGEELFHIRFDD